MDQIYEVKYGDKVYKLRGPEGLTTEDLTAIIEQQQAPQPVQQEQPVAAPPAQAAPQGFGGRLADAAMGSVQDMGDPKGLLGLGDAALTLGSGLAGAVGGGFAGLGSLALGRGAEKSAQTVKAVSDALTWSPKTEVAQQFFSDVAPVMEWIDNTVKDVSSFGGRANPLVSTSIETGANALAMLVGPGAVKAGVVTGLNAGKTAGVRAGIEAGIKATARESMPAVVHASEKARAAQQADINRIAKSLEEQAKAVGIELRTDKIHKSVRNVVEGLSSDVRGSGFKMVSDRLNAAHLRARAVADKKWEDFRAQPHFLDVSWAEGMVRPMAEELAGRGFNIKSTPVAESLEDIRLLNKRVTTAVNKEGTDYRTVPGNLKIKRQSLNEIQAIRQRIMKRAEDAGGSSDGQALKKIGERLDEMLDAQFRADAAKGMEAPWEAWKGARSTWEQYKNNWNEFKAVKNILTDPDMTPQKLANEILGTSSMLGSKQSSRIYDHIMQLTNNDPGIKIAIEGSVMYDLVKPLIDNPDAKSGAYAQVANNIRRFRKENPELIKAMGMDDMTLRTIQHAARAAEHTKVGDAIGLFDTMIKGVTRHLVGHKIAQAGFRVNLAERILRRIAKRDETSHKEMLSEFAGIDQSLISTKVPKEELLKALARGEMASQYQNLAEWDDEY